MAFCQERFTTLNRYEEILRQSVCCHDPIVKIQSNWLVRGISPHRTRVLISDLREEKDVESIFSAMGFETGNIHVGSTSSRNAVVAHPPRIELKALRPLDIVLEHELAQHA
jgi:hypothetical protein